MAMARHASANRLLRCVCARYLPDLHLTCSVGVACLENHHGDLAEWMNEADTALYKSKSRQQYVVMALFMYIYWLGTYCCHGTGLGSPCKLRGQ